HPAGLPPANSRFEAEDDNNFTTDAKWWVGTVLPRALRFKRRLHRCNACNPDGVCKDRDTKAELNHHGQICEVLIDTGISHRGKTIPSAPNRVSGQAAVAST